MAEGPAAGLAIIDVLLGERQLQSYHLLQAVRGDLLFKLGRYREAGEAFETAAGMTLNGAERTLLTRRAAEAAAAANEEQGD
jgi:predicted RNA polymerase sigma factor